MTSITCTLPPIDTNPPPTRTARRTLRSSRGRRGARAWAVLRKLVARVPRPATGPFDTPSQRALRTIDEPTWKN